MTFQFASDLHLEFPENRAWLLDHPLEPVADVLLLAGDVLPLHQVPAHRKLLNDIARPFKEVIWIPGNHEYYGNSIPAEGDDIDAQPVPKWRIVNNRSVQSGNARILCTTLWTAISQLNESHMRRSMNDYLQIRHGGKLLLPAHTTRLHDRSLAWLKAELAKPFSGPTVVMTHHVPTMMHYPERFKGDILNEAFAVELHDLIEASPIHTWIFGHHHYNTPAFTIGGTCMRTNQMGYVQYGEQKGFDRGGCFEVEGG